MFRSLALSMTLLAAVPAQGGAFLSSAGHTVLERPVSSQLEVIGGPRNRGAASYFCAAAEAASARLNATGTDRLRIEGMPRGGTGAVFTLLRGRQAPDGFRFQILARPGSTISVAAARGQCRF